MNRIHAWQPSRLTDADHAMQAAAVARAERQHAAANRKERVCRLAVCAAAVAAPFVFFYSIGSY